MSGIALDYDTHIPGAILKAAGYTEVFRYLTDLDHPELWPKGLTLAEVEDLHANGIKIHLNRETTANFMLGGWSLGYLEAKRCRAWALRLGFAADEPIIYSADFQIVNSEQTLIDSFNAGAASIDGAKNVWNYGQFSVVKRCLDNGYGGGWQITNSWSEDSLGRPLRDPRAYAYQLVEQVSVNGVLCDKNEINPNYQSEVSVATIPASIAQKWPSLALEFPPDVPYDDSNAGIWADAGARYAAEQSDKILEEVIALKTAPPSNVISLSDADVERVAQRVAQLLGTKLSA